MNLSKRYQHPETLVTMIKSTSMLCTSTPQLQSDDASTSSTQDGGGYMLVKGTNYVKWDETWE